MSNLAFYKSSVGTKFIMAITGLVWAGFVFGHMAGNMLMFVSADAYNLYGHAITSGYLIYVIEIVLIAALMVHVISALSLVIRNGSARKEGYYVQSRGSKSASWASRTMAVQGSMILAFVIYHIATFKFGPVYWTEIEGQKVRDLYRLVTEVFAQPGYVMWYILCLVLLGFHLSHGIGSLIQSTGLLNDRTQKWSQSISRIYGIVVAAGFLSQPIVMFFR